MVQSKYRLIYLLINPFVLTFATAQNTLPIDQQLDLWTGRIESRYTVEGAPVQVELYGHQDADQIAFRITSPLIAAGRLKVNLRFPYGSEEHVGPGYNWEVPGRHETRIIQAGANAVL